MRRLSLASLLVAVCACSSIDYSDTSNPIAACRSFAHASCQVESNCNPGAVDVDSCTQLSSQSCNQSSCGQGTTYSAQDGAQCLQDYLNQDCADSNNGVIPATCAITALCPATP